MLGYFLSTIQNVLRVQFFHATQNDYIAPAFGLLDLGFLILDFVGYA